MSNNYSKCMRFSYRLELYGLSACGIFHAFFKIVLVRPTCTTFLKSYKELLRKGVFSPTTALNNLLSPTPAITFQKVSPGHPPGGPGGVLSYIDYTTQESITSNGFQLYGYVPLARVWFSGLRV